MEKFFGAPDASGDGSVVSLTRTLTWDEKKHIYRQFPTLYAAPEMERVDGYQLFESLRFADLLKTAPPPDDAPPQITPLPPGEKGLPVSLKEEQIAAQTWRDPAGTEKSALGVISVKKTEKSKDALLFGMMPGVSSSMTGKWRAERVKKRLVSLMASAKVRINGQERGLLPTDFIVKGPKKKSGEWRVESPLLKNDPDKGVVITADALFAAHWSKTPQELAQRLQIAVFDMLTDKDIFNGSGRITVLGANSAENLFTKGFMKMGPNHSQADLAEAEQYFKNAIDCNRSYLDAYVALCRAQLDQGKNAEAQKTLDRMQKRFSLTPEYQAIVNEMKASLAKASLAKPESGTAP